jgi:hypothetical protein
MTRRRTRRRRRCLAEEGAGLGVEHLGGLQAAVARDGGVEELADRVDVGLEALERPGREVLELVALALQVALGDQGHLDAGLSRKPS